ncbi:MAG: hypothetical protein CMJ49_12055 [Planctomycetaceae bacterium]|nr:hypothetical protein [Planctomycetaceae bacterium]
MVRRIGPILVIGAVGVVAAVTVADPDVDAPAVTATTQPATEDPAAIEETEVDPSASESLVGPPATTERIKRAPPAATTQPLKLTERQKLMKRIERALSESVFGLRGSEQVRRIDQLIADCSRMVELTPDGPLRLSLLNIQMQGFNNNLTNNAGLIEVEMQWKRLRGAARRAKAMDEPEAQAVGDYWLLVANLNDIKDSGLPLDKQREQSMPLLKRYLKAHPKASLAPAVFTALGQLDPAATQPATSQPATSQPATTQPATSQPVMSRPATTQPAPGATSQPAAAETTIDPAAAPVEAEADE